MKSSLHRAASCYAFSLLFVMLDLNLEVIAGTITVGNHSASKVINGKTGLPVMAAEGIRVALYYAPIGSSNFIQMGAVASIGIPMPGLFAAGTRTTDLMTPAGTSGQFQLRAWSGGFGTFEQAVGEPGVLLGQSRVVEAVMGNPEGDPPTPPGALIASGLSGFTLTTNSGQPLVLRSAANRTVASGSNWSFDPPIADGGCTVNLIITIVNTVTNGSCPQVITRTWWATDNCGGSETCTQNVTVVDPSCLAFSAQMVGSQLGLCWCSASNLSYQVQYCTNLVSGTWLDFGSPISGNGTTNRIFDSSFSSEAQRFYRLVWLGN